MSAHYNPRDSDGARSVTSSERVSSSVFGEEEEEEEEESDGDNQFDVEARFPHPLDEFRSDEPHCCLITFKEVLARELSAQIRDKPDWVRKIEDRKLFQKWVLEARKYWEPQIKARHSYLVSLWDADTIRYTYTELHDHYALWVREQGENGIHPVIDCVWKADGRVIDDLRRELIQGEYFLSQQTLTQGLILLQLSKH